MKNKPFLHALTAAIYIVLVVFVMDMVTSFTQMKETILVPMTVLGIFVLSAAVMGYLFLSEPLKLYFENRKDEATKFFLQTIGYFAFFALAFILTLIYS